MSDDFWSDFIVGDQNFDGNVDYFDQMIVDDECKEIGHVSFGGGGRSAKKSSQVPVKDEPVIEGSPFKIFAFECFYFVACTFIMFFISLIPWVVIMVLCGVDDTTNPVMVASLITGIVVSIPFTIAFHYTNKEQIEKKRKNKGKDFITKDK